MSALELKPYDRCNHGVTFDRLPSGAPTPCTHCDLEWHESCLNDALAAVDRHKRKIAEAVAAISRTCGDA